MKFKYLEQHAKLDLMHNLTGEEGKILEQGENEEKGRMNLTDVTGLSVLISFTEERTNAKKKAALKANKVHLEELRAEALKLSHEVSSCKFICGDQPWGITNTALTSSPSRSRRISRRGEQLYEESKRNGA